MSAVLWNSVEVHLTAPGEIEKVLVSCPLNMLSAQTALNRFPQVRICGAVDQTWRARPS
jgi:hypothetical protein